jgi:hypothetical protein
MHGAGAHSYGVTPYQPANAIQRPGRGEPEGARLEGCPRAQPHSAGGHRGQGRDQDRHILEDVYLPHPERRQPGVAGHREQVGDGHWGGYSDSTYPTTLGLYNTTGSTNGGSFSSPEANSLINASVDSSDPLAVRNEMAYLPGIFQPLNDNVFVMSRKLSGTGIVRVRHPVSGPRRVPVFHEVARVFPGAHILAGITKHSSYIFGMIKIDVEKLLPLRLFAIRPSYDSPQNRTMLQLDGSHGEPARHRGRRITEERTVDEPRKG